MLCLLTGGGGCSQAQGLRYVILFKAFQLIYLGSLAILCLPSQSKNNKTWFFDDRTGTNICHALHVLFTGFLGTVNEYNIVSSAAPADSTLLKVAGFVDFRTVVEFALTIRAAHHRYHLQAMFIGENHK